MSEIETDRERQRQRVRDRGIKHLCVCGWVCKSDGDEDGVSE